MADVSALNIVSDVIDPDEKVLWQGRPRQGLVLRTIDWLLVPFSIMWCHFAVMWEHMILFGTGRSPPKGPPFMLALLGGAFIAIGLYFVFGRFIADWYYRANLAYTVTDKRVLIVSRAFGRSTNSIDVRRTSGLRLDEGAEGRGTIHFSESAVARLWNTSSFAYWHAALGKPEMLFDIDGARAVYELLRRKRQGG